LSELVRVLVVDDSAYVRKVVSQMLSRSPFIDVVGIARNGAEALELVEEVKPDVVTCDLNMPVLDDVGFV
jgi:two-component system, chemotaxis family, protein-glutamate methylesterase/glutaminase